MTAEAFERAAEAIRAADSLIITAGAGLGVDSGLPDFRGGQGFWRAYPALGKAGLAFEEIANPAAFRSHPALAWGFYGHRLAMYRATPPGEAFAILKSIAAMMPAGAFVFTSNVDGHFQRAGFPAAEVWECHGSIHHLQCVERCTEDIWPADSFVPEEDAERCLLINEPPHCPRCGALARPNILMFGDWDWIERRSESRRAAYQAWSEQEAGNPVVIELGAGTAIPTVRRFSERAGKFLVRINPTEPDLGVARDGVALPMGAAEAMWSIWQAITATLKSPADRAATATHPTLANNTVVTGSRP